jgi:DNA-binding CsgD family transcriptional regulator
MDKIIFNDGDMLDFILKKMPVGVVVYDDDIGITYRNRNAKAFIKRYGLPREVAVICRRIFSALNDETFKVVFPGEVYLYKRVDGSTSNWTFRFHMADNSKRSVVVFITEEAVSHKVNLNEVRMRFRLTRREQDVLRRVLGGMRNSEISEDLGISMQTVKDHLSKIYMKCVVRNRFGLLSAIVNPSRAADLPVSFKIPAKKPSAREKNNVRA